MLIANIFLTHENAEEFEPLEHNGTRYEFVQISADVSQKLVDGPVWAFVDWVLDDMSGLELCRRLRANPQTAQAHITMVLEDENLEVRKRALQAGADDYMIGPIDRRTVLDRVFALNPCGGFRFAADRFQRGPLSIDLLAHRAFWNDEVIDVNPNEFRLLRLLGENANRILSREEIIAGLGKDAEPIDERTVDVWIGRLRRPIKAAGGGNPLRTVRSLGYVFDLD